MLNKSELYISALERAKFAFSVKTDMALAEVLGMDRSSLSKLKSRGSFPYRNIVDVCADKNISVDFILGIKPEKKSDVAAK